MSLDVSLATKGITILTLKYTTWCTAEFGLQKTLFLFLLACSDTLPVTTWSCKTSMSSSDNPVLPCSTRQHPGATLNQVDNPERIIFPTRPQQPASHQIPSATFIDSPIRAASAPPAPDHTIRGPPLIQSKWDLIVNPPNPQGYLVVMATWPLPGISVSLDQLSDNLVPAASQPSLPRPKPRRSVPGSFDPQLSILASEPSSTTQVMDQQSSSLTQDVNVARTKAENEQLCQDNVSLRAEMGDICRLLENLLAQQKPPVGDVTGGSSGDATSTQRPPHVDPSLDHGSQTAQIFTLTPVVNNQGNLFHVPASLPSVPETAHIPMISHVDLSKFRASDWPQYKGAFGDVAAFRLWQYQMESIFWRTFVGKTWEQVMVKMQSVVLPVGWDEAAKEKLRELTMKPNESCTAYCGRARLIQEEIGVEGCPDETLAYVVVGGMGGTFKAWAKMEKVVQKSLDATGRFSFPIFEERVGSIWLLTQAMDALGSNQSQLSEGRNSSTSAPAPNIQNQFQSNNGTQPFFRPALSSEEIMARNVCFGAYMCLIGLCPRCKSPCDKWLGGCTAKANTAFFSVPIEFPRVVPYPPPKSISGNVVGRSTSTIGTPRLVPRKVDVAAVESGGSAVVADVGDFPDLGRVDLAAYDALVAKLNKPTDEVRTSSQSC
ncbi:uncharacterized protein MELLADRAFT_108828 [Melampsora larici-populina 98AG31]|uniref:Retrotransposon gag domain-containing protein n=1 Tax=Melampsora larici-populina (strain 98AG31 / pathotype 3-4-7) TaxID=747676 RepID=F4RUE5_MELLP|nr:uncharacterized protein MELLADRAFT_108828 [Melampsora larici-populina 98AG31]EGG03919.1 hypothetical protein MELLADRAFT_108828 [Melampsora larici-populina 98AG31]